jgi:hypothetical protein
MAVASSDKFAGRGEELTRLLAPLERAERGLPADLRRPGRPLTPCAQRPGLTVGHLGRLAAAGDGRLPGQPGPEPPTAVGAASFRP